MDTRAHAIEFFKAGGTLHADSPSYVKRPTDEELFKQILAGQFCYVLTARQRGKSSLMIRTVERLRKAGIQAAIVDLSGLGAQVTSAQWYLGIIKRIALDLRLSGDPERWWSEHSALGPVQRFTDFLHDVVLAQIGGRIVIFVDEIDSTLKLDFRDDFFAAIRAMYNARASDPAYNRLTFVLLGVATPTDLIRDRNRTPFNIGYAIDLQELNRDDAQPLQNGLDQVTTGQGQRILDRIFYWTNGHPYLTQKLCLEIAESPDGGWPDERIDALVHQLFLTEEARKESNLQFIRSSVEASPERRRLLGLYRQVYEGKLVAEDERPPLQKRLELIGLVRVHDGALQVRNEIYRRIFDLDWIKQSTPTNWTLIASISTVVIAILALAAAVLIVQRQQAQTIADKVKFSTERFRSSTDVDVKMIYLAGLCDIKQDQVAQSLFFDQQPNEQLKMFKDVKAKEAGDSLMTVARCLYPALSEQYGVTDHGEALLQAMSCALHRASRDDAEQLRKQIGYDGACLVGQ